MNLTASARQPASPPDAAVDDHSIVCRQDGDSIIATVLDQVLSARQLAGLTDSLFTQHPDQTRIEWRGEVPGGIAPVQQRETFYQQRPWWHRAATTADDDSWTQTGDVAHPRRHPLPAGLVYERRIHALDQTFRLHRIDPDRDLERFTRWMNDPRVSEFWEQPGPADVQRAYIEKVLADPHVDPMIASLDDQPFAYFELYWALEDRLGPYYDAEPYDRGMHLLVGETNCLGHVHARAWINSVCHFMWLDEARTHRLVGEPRADNAGLLKYLASTPGWRKVREFDFPHKRAALLMCDRQTFFADTRFT
ncbi:GNAT family N-acetyltransferase [uncultured Abyssibacter sp.]|uniref:GNAT family N-acetyltransferase n=1 Tax=uncultured Abyssibacter sp. TaxID=2320202 RepID=UPI0032B1D1A1